MIIVEEQNGFLWENVFGYYNIFGMFRKIKRLLESDYKSFSAYIVNSEAFKSLQ